MDYTRQEGEGDPRTDEAFTPMDLQISNAELWRNPKFAEVVAENHMVKWRFRWAMAGCGALVFVMVVVMIILGAVLGCDDGEDCNCEPPPTGSPTTSAPTISPPSPPGLELNKTQLVLFTKLFLNPPSDLATIVSNLTDSFGVPYSSVSILEPHNTTDDQYTLTLHNTTNTFFRHVRGEGEVNVSTVQYHTCLDSDANATISVLACNGTIIGPGVRVIVVIGSVTPPAEFSGLVFWTSVSGGFELLANKYPTGEVNVGQSVQGAAVTFGSGVDIGINAWGCFRGANSATGLGLVMYLMWVVSQRQVKQGITFTWGGHSTLRPFAKDVIDIHSIASPNTYQQVHTNSELLFPFLSKPYRVVGVPPGAGSVTMLMTDPFHTPTAEEAGFYGLIPSVLGSPCEGTPCDDMSMVNTSEVFFKVADSMLRFIENITES
eukprot:TRINITY_DN13914_c7_g1_i1.p1 TRINITY_DN13914_c7_g1~~TRINITY_DN13914_c7_g1_i1.p1  ORF type:complete len:433 (+),score=52.17 TRINITY_DN13914_c7_g1_i1:77-1375(+)